MDTRNSAADEPELAEPYLREVLGTAGLAVEYVRAEGNTLYRRGEDGGEIPIADFAGGYGSVLLGHHHPDIVRCAHELLDAGTPVHAQFSRHPYANRLAAELNRIVHRELDTDEPYFAIFANTGAEAVEAAVKHAEMDRVMRIGELREELDRAADAARAAVSAGTATVADRVLRRFGITGSDTPAAALEELVRHLARQNAEQTERPPLFLALEGGFHGKLGTSVQLTHNEHYRTPFRSLAAQARFVPWDRPEALKEIHARERGVVFELVVAGGQVDVVEREFPVFCAFLVEPIQGEGGIHVNAGIGGALGLDVSEQDWDRSIDVNLRAHIRAARLLVPRWLERGEGYFVSTASAAGLLTQIGSATYAVTKHAAVAFAEWLSVTYGDRGVRVSCLCPMGVNTRMLTAGEDSGDALGRAATRAVTSAGDVLEPAEVADAVLAAIEDERFLVLPHEDVLEMYRQKGSDYDRWVRGMRRYQSSLLAQA